VDAGLRATAGVPPRRRGRSGRDLRPDDLDGPAELGVVLWIAGEALGIVSTQDLDVGREPPRTRQRAALGREPAGRSEPERSPVGQWDDGLDRRAARRLRPDPRGPRPVLQGARDDLRPRGRAVLDEDGEREIERRRRGAGGESHVLAPNPALGVRHQLVREKEQIAHLDGGGEQSAGIAPEIEDEGARALGTEGVDGGADLTRGRLAQRRDPDVADSPQRLALDTKRGDRPARDDEISGLTPLLACDHEHRLAAGLAPQQAIHGGDLEAVRRYAVDREDTIAGA